MPPDARKAIDLTLQRANARDVSPLATEEALVDHCRRLSNERDVNSTAIERT